MAQSSLDEAHSEPVDALRASVEPERAADGKWVGARFKELFQAHYIPKLKPGQTADNVEKAVRAEAALGFSGWDRSARNQRAEIVAANPPG